MDEWMIYGEIKSSMKVCVIPCTTTWSFKHGREKRSRPGPRVAPEYHMGNLKKKREADKRSFIILGYYNIKYIT